MHSTATKTERISAIDFTKGALVLTMVLYHWLNYFYASHGDVYRYLRFLPPSFICISGFLVSSVYFAKYGPAHPGLSLRLARRGLKILAIFLFLNLAGGVLLSAIAHAPAPAAFFSPVNLVAVFLSGNIAVVGAGKSAAFFILVPIAYLLLLSALLALFRGVFPYVFHVLFLCFLLLILLLHHQGLQSGNLELLSIGLLGVLLGFLPAHRIAAFIRYPFPFAAAYLGYLAAVTYWEVSFPLEVAAVLLNLMLFFFLGTVAGEFAGIRRLILLLGNYTLFGYIAQIAILQVLRLFLRRLHLENGLLPVSFIAAFTLTILSIVLLDRARAKSSALDGLYKAVFA
ncbi:MAG: hypothetical protein LAN71_00490 [Acidobacteriia bacterium]|nr:hypothetical protein [Terriglobia bacterium]